MPKAQVNSSNPPNSPTMVGMAVLMTVTSTAAMKVETSMAPTISRAWRCGGGVASGASEAGAARPGCVRLMRV